MATTYGYAGEFSSDEDVDQQAQQTLNQQDPFNQLKPTKEEINDILETIRNVSPDKNVDFPDDTLAALLDHFKIQRGPIVDSTRGLYKKIALRAIRGNLHSEATNGSSEQNNNNGGLEFDNNKPIEVSSSDDDEPMAPVFTQEGVDMVNGASKPEPMEVDLDVNKSNQLQMRENKQIEISSSSDSEADDETEESDNDDTVVSRANEAVVGAEITQPIASTPISKGPRIKQTPKSKAKSSSKLISEVEEKKHYTRSRRLVSTGQLSNLSSSDASAGASLLASEASGSKLETSTKFAAKQTNIVKSRDRMLSIKFN